MGRNRLTLINCLFKYDEFLASRQNYVLRNLDAKRSHVTNQDATLRLLGHGFNAHGANIPAPPVLHFVVLYVNLLVALSLRSLIANIDVFEIFALDSQLSNGLLIGGLNHHCVTDGTIVLVFVFLEWILD